MERKTEIFEESIRKLMNEWAKKIDEPLKEIKQLNLKLDELDAKDDLTPEEERLRTKAVAKRKELQGKVDAAHSELQNDLSYIKPPPDPPKGDMEEAIKRIKKTVSTIQNGLPLKEGIRLQPDVDFDWTKLKFKKLGVVLTWKF